MSLGLYRLLDIDVFKIFVASSWGYLRRLLRKGKWVCIGFCCWLMWHLSMQIVAIRDIIPPPQREAFNDVYIAYELMDTDLHQIIRSNQGLSEEHCQVRIRTFNSSNNNLKTQLKCEYPMCFSKLVSFFFRFLFLVKKWI